MSKNYFLEVGEILGVKPFEEFRITDYDLFYRFTPQGLQFSKDRVEWRNSSLLYSLICGKNEIIIPFIPKIGQTFYTPSSHLSTVESCLWHENIADIALLKAGLVFRTESECDNALEELRSKYPSVVESLKSERCKV